MPRKSSTRSGSPTIQRSIPPRRRRRTGLTRRTRRSKSARRSARRKSTRKRRRSHLLCTLDVSPLPPNLGRGGAAAQPNNSNKTEGFLFRVVAPSPARGGGRWHARGRVGEGADGGKARSLWLGSSALPPGRGQAPPLLWVNTCTQVNAYGGSPSPTLSSAVRNPPTCTPTAAAVFPSATRPGRLP